MTTKADNCGLNSTLCGYNKQFDLPEQYKVTVCSYQQQVRIDIRYFIGNTSSIRGIAVNKRQYNYLQRLTPNINHAVKQAERER